MFDFHQVTHFLKLLERVVVAIEAFVAVYEKNNGNPPAA